jgi:hypothetical protein
MARNEYDIVLNSTTNIHKIKEVFASAFYEVTSLQSAPIASRVDEIPYTFLIDYLDAVDKANAGENALRLITEDVSETQFNISHITFIESAAS